MIRYDIGEGILEALPCRRGHFLLESGYHSDLWLSLDALFLDPNALAPHVAALAELVRPYDVSATCGPLLGGAFLAQALAAHLGVRFYYCQPTDAASEGQLFTATYRLPNDLARRAENERVAVVDDLISAGSSVRAAVAALTAAGATPVVVGALLTLGTAAIDHFSDIGMPLVALGRTAFDLWAPTDCPHCLAGVPLEDPAFRS
jgi:orotate phosphoribosyltransferase